MRVFIVVFTKRANQSDWMKKNWMIVCYTVDWRMKECFDRKRRDERAILISDSNLSRVGMVLLHRKYIGLDIYNYILCFFSHHTFTKDSTGPHLFLGNHADLAVKPSWRLESGSWSGLVCTSVEWLLLFRHCTKGMCRRGKGNIRM